ncbi:ATP-binding cassette domain-containing protein, partial [Streptomyces katsurahamanus]
MTAILAEGLYAYYGTAPAVNGLSLTVPAGVTFGFLGPNGAGKTTTISMLTTLIRPTSGRAEVAGFDVATRPAEVRRRIGIVFQESTLDLELTAAENLRFQADLCGLSRHDARVAIAAMLDMMELSERSKIPVQQFSAGLRRRLEIARGLLGSPRILFLDEPTTGLDAQTRAAVWEYLNMLRRERGITVFFTTHQLEEAEHCDRIAIIDRGKVITQGTPAELKAIIGADLVVLRTEDDPRAAEALAERFGLVADPTPDGLRLRVSDGAALVPRLCTELGLTVRSVTITSPTI